ncbi:MAG: hypothetical protein HC933_12450 [Pleurocapsa sp. SU_196_0]|nr:hypothetical protein [Pleurocapsa sp. SU_196_0]
MPNDLIGINTFTSSIPNFPISGNNEPMTIEPIIAAFQITLNNTVANKTRLDTLETSGVKRIRTFLTRAALSAATGLHRHRSGTRGRLRHLSALQPQRTHR